MAFIGSDKVNEWTLDGKIKDIGTVDSIPIDCRIVLAGKSSRVRDIPTMLGRGDTLTVATSYPNLMEKFARDQSLNLAKTYTPTGSCESYAASGRTDLVFDIVQSGNTLKQNDLLVFRESENLSLNVIDSIKLTDNQKGMLEVRLDKVTKTYFERLILSRSDAKVESFLVAMYRDQNKMVKKYGEESMELMQALLRRPKDREEIINEGADLVNILRIFLTTSGITLEDVLEEDIKRNEDKE